MLNHYNYAFNGKTNTYDFPTKNNILYRIAFIEDYTLSEISGESIPYIFQLVIEKVGDKIEPFDSKVSETIKFIISEFFEKSHRSIIYVCSNEEEKAEQRFKVFNRWYEASNFKQEIVKIDNVIQLDSASFNIKIFTSLLYHVRNENAQKILDVYNLIEEVLNRK